MVDKEIKLIISDIDGTILSDTHVVDSDLKNQVAKLHQKGIPFVLASARSPKGIIPLADQLGITNDPIAAYNGALVLERQGNDYVPIFNHSLDKQEIVKLIKIIKEHFSDLSINLYSNQDWYVETYDHWAQREGGITRETPIIENFDSLLLDESRPIHKLLVIGETAEIEGLLRLCKELDLENSAFYLSQANYLEVTHHAVSKERALKEIAGYFSTPLEQVMTIGDNYNDVPMLSAAGLGIAMGNAPKKVKEKAQAETSNNNANGASKAVINYVLKRQKHGQPRE